jgi:hypothetical protein
MQRSVFAQGKESAFTGESMANPRVFEQMD